VTGAPRKLPFVQVRGNVGNPVPYRFDGHLRMNRESGEEVSNDKEEALQALQC